MAHTLEEMVVLVERFNEVDHTLSPADVQKLIEHGFTPEKWKQFIETGTNAAEAGLKLSKALKRLDEKILKQITSMFKKVKWPRKSKKQLQKKILSVCPELSKKFANKLALQNLKLINALSQFNIK